MPYPKKSHCKRGHPFDKATERGVQVCLICRADTLRARRGLRGPSPSDEPTSRRDQSFRRRLKRFGLSRERYDQLHADGCAICHRTFGPVHFDHDHVTGQFRGLLCPLCNKGLGQFRDNATTLRDAATYLDAARPALP